MAEPHNREHAEAHKYPNVIRFVRETPWAILEPKLLEIQQMVDAHVRGHAFTEAEIAARIGSGPARRDGFQTSGGVAVIPIYGVITPKADLMTEMSGGTSIDRLQQSLRQAVADEKVKSIVLDVNSPGGSVSMLTEMAGEIRQARRVKPVVAVANGMAASAAYHLASQASEFYVTPSGSVGAIGTIVTHEDVSGALEQAGVKTTVVTSSKYKGELSPYKPLTEDARAQLQSLVDKHGATFEQDVARGRGVPVDTVRSDYGQGRMLLARDALNAGMVDGVQSLDDVIARLEKQQTDAKATFRSMAEAVTTASANFQGGSSLPGCVEEQPVTEEAARRADDPPGADSYDHDFRAAHSGLSFADATNAARDAVLAVVGGARELREFKDDRFTRSKRDGLAALSEVLRESLDDVTALVEQTTPRKPQDATAEYERLRLIEGATR